MLYAAARMTHAGTYLIRLKCIRGSYGIRISSAILSTWEYGICRVVDLGLFWVCTRVGWFCSLIINFDQTCSIYWEYYEKKKRCQQLLHKQLLLLLLLFTTSELADALSCDKCEVKLKTGLGKNKTRTNDQQKFIFNRIILKFSGFK